MEDRSARPSIGWRLGARTQRPAPVDHGNPAGLCIDNQAFENTIAGERDNVARIKAEYALVAMKPGAAAKPQVEREDHLRDLVPFGP